MTTSERRLVVTQVQGRFGVSERRACAHLGFERTMIRYVPQRPARDAPLRAVACAGRTLSAVGRTAAAWAARA